MTGMKERGIFDSRLAVLLWHYIGMVLLFMIEKPLFMLYAAPDRAGYGFADCLSVIWHGLPIDFSVAGYLTLFPLLAVIVSVWVEKFPLKRVIQVYDAALALLLSLIFLGDSALYPFWGYKLDASVLFYLKTPKEAFASISPIMAVLGFVLVFVLAWLIFLLLTFVLRPYDRKLRKPLRKILAGTGFVLLAAPLLLAIRGGVKESTMNVGHAYFSQDQFLNHSAVNPGFSLISSMSKTSDYSQWYEYFPEPERAELADKLFNVNDSCTVNLLSKQRPNVLLVVLEGFGADFIGRLGGLDEVAPNMNRLLDDGVCFSNCYAGSYRTDRGLVCIMNGHPGLPVTSIMKIPVKSAKLPSLASVFAENGYSTTFMYGGDINFTNMKSWLYGAGFQKVIADVDFSVAERHTNAWGVNDEITFPRLLSELEGKEQDKPWFTAFLSLSSHEPFDVPYRRLADDIPNSFAYTDSCLGAFIDSLKNSGVWDNLLMVVTADHGFRYPATGHAQAPHVHHIPFVMTGGAVSAPADIDVIMNQTDIAATVLGQLGMEHDGFLFSRNVLSGSYDRQFAFYTFNNGFCMIDSAGVTMYDDDASACLVQEGDSTGFRLDTGKALLQTLYDDLERR